MKIALTDLKKAIQWIDANSKDTHVQLLSDGYQMWVEVSDKYGAKVTITMYENGTLLPKIQKQDYL